MQAPTERERFALLGLKRCTKCRKVRPSEDFHRDAQKKDGRTCRCKYCEHEDKHTYYLANSDKWRSYRNQNADRIRANKRRAYAAKMAEERATRPRASCVDCGQEIIGRRSDASWCLDCSPRCDYNIIRAQVFAHYGTSCVCCHATDRLTLDHVDGDGASHRKELFGGRIYAGRRFYLWLLANNFPQEPVLQVLCLRCNASKGTGSRCLLVHQ